MNKVDQKATGTTENKPRCKNYIKFSPQSPEIRQAH
jgi:hypothetical protein